MSLSDINLAPDYNKAYDNIAEKFYLPCMRASNNYSRISGYFSSTIYIIAWSALKDFVNNGGKMRIVCSPFLSDADAAAISEGYDKRYNDILSNSMVKEIEDLFKNPFLERPSRALACLIACGIIEVKIAIPNGKSNQSIERLFHDKIGIFEDKFGNSVGFRGPMNETYKGLSNDGNLESIDVFPSWVDSRDVTRLENVKLYFEQIWLGLVDSVSIYEFPTAAKEILVEKSNGHNWEKLVEDISRETLLSDKWNPDIFDKKRKPRPHQVEALENWVKNGRRGIFKHATGSGKTYSAICAIKNALDQNNSVILVVPSIDLLNQWKNELTSTLSKMDVRILLCGGGNTYWRKNEVLKRWTQKSNIKRIVLVTVDTAATDYFIGNVVDGEHLLLVADEVHRLGSPNRQKIFKINAGARLGLSATPERYGHPEETKALFEYFGDIMQPEFSLQDAIKSGVLTQYVYSPLQVILTPKEQNNWNRITKEINRLIGKLGSTSIEFSEILKDKTLKNKFIARSRIVKNAENKMQLALEIIRKNYKEGQRWIIYCDNKKQLRNVLNLLLDDGYNAFEYHSEMVGDRKTTLDYFSLVGGILVSIKCLDEGVDIPATTHALILASSKNPREFIQRRGRILRNHKGKSMAYLYDAITIPNNVEGDEYPYSNNIIIGELSRAIQFGSWAVNPSCITVLKNMAIDLGIDFENQVKNGEEDDEE